MSKMYYDEHPDAQHDIHELDVVLLGEQMKFLTDAGVFSKKMIDFGSQVLLSCLSFQQGEMVLDVGCGYGPLGLSLVKAQGIHATMVDVNTRALDLAQKNADLNQLKQRSSNPMFMIRLREVLIILSVTLPFGLGKR